jgi:hypothetical protein
VPGERHALRRLPPERLVSSLGWQDDVVEQFLYDHADNIGFLRDYGDLDLSEIEWDVEVIPGLPT